MREKGRETEHCGLPMFCGTPWPKSRFPKAAGAEPFGEQMKYCMPLWQKADQTLQTPRFGEIVRNLSKVEMFQQCS